MKASVNIRYGGVVLFMTVLLLLLTIFSISENVFAEEPGGNYPQPAPTQTGGQPTQTGGQPTQTGGQPTQTGGGGVQTVLNPLRFPSVQAFFQAILDFILILALPFIIFMIVYTGFLFVTARGDTPKLQTAKNMLMWTIIGGMIILGATVIAQVIRNTVDNITLLTEITRFL